MKKQFAILLAVTMLFSMCIDVFAIYGNQYLNPYTPESAGPMYYAVDIANPVSLANGASVSGGRLSMSSGSRAEYDLYFDYDIEDVEVSYQVSSERTLTVSVDGNAHEVTLASGSSSVTNSIVERKGSHTISLSVNGSAVITAVKFKKHKIDEYGIDSNVAHFNIEYNDYDKAMQTAVVVSTSKIALKVNGAFRYLDYTDTSLAPLNIDGRIYLPIHAAARAFSLYYEDYPDLAYAYMSNDDFEIYQKEDDCYVVINGEKLDDYGRFAIYVNGTTWVPFRQLAELVGDKVEWREDIDGKGYAVADDRIRVKAIVSDDTIFQNLVDEFSQFDIDGLKREKTYYVSAVSGSDSNNGLSEAAPFKTIQKAADFAKAGDTVIIHGGVYREEVVVKNSGTATKPIVFKAADGEDVTISAFDKVSGFVDAGITQGGNRLYKTTVKSLGYDRNFIIYNDEILREGRYPDYDTKTVAGPHPNLPRNDMRATMGSIAMPNKDSFNKTFPYKNTTAEYKYDFAISDNELNQTKNAWVGATFVTLTGQAFTQSYGYIDASDNHTNQDNTGWIHLVDDGRGGYDFLGGQSGDKTPDPDFYRAKTPYDYGYITHHRDTVTQPGEWYIDYEMKYDSGKRVYNEVQEGKTLYIIPPSGISGTSLEIELKQRQRVIDMRGKKFVQFHNINTRGGGVTMAGDTEMDILDGGVHKYISQIDMTAAHATHDGRYKSDRKHPDVPVSGGDGPELGEVGFFTHGKNNAFVNTSIFYSAQAGIYTTGLYTFIENNYIENASYMGSYPGAITLEGLKWNTSSITGKCGGHTVVANTCVGSGRGNLYMSRGKVWENGNETEMSFYPYIACDLSYNRLQMGAVTSRDTGNVYIHGVSAGNDLIKTGLHHNVVYDIGTKEQYSKMNALIYHDGFASFINTYSNMTFDTAKGYVQYDIYQHTSKEFFRNYVERWGNVSLGTITSGVTCDLQDTFSKKDYPYGKPFDVGSTKDGHRRFMLNYNSDPNCNIKYAGESLDATLGSGAELGDDGFVTLPNGSAYIDFKNVTFYDTGTEFSIFYSSDKYQYGKNVGTAAKPKYESEIPKFTIELYRNGTGGTAERKIVEDIYSHATNIENESRFIMYFKPQTQTTYTVRVKVSKNYVRPCKLMTAKLDFNAKAQEDWPYPLDGDTILFGSLTNSGGTLEKEHLFFDELDIHNKQNHTYSDVSTSSFTFTKKFTDNQTKVSMRVSTDYQYVNGKVQIYLDGTGDNNLISEFYINDYIDENGVITGKNWMPIVITKQLKRTITATEHTITIKFSKRDPSEGAPFPVLSTFWVSFHSLPFSGSSPTLAELQQQGN